MSIPISTYRVQLNKSFTFKDLDVIIDYLEALGITTIYASPITTADKGSTHGYDVIDSNKINPEIGTLEELEALAKRLKEKNMNWIQDIVPNHMAFSFDNPRLVDILERGIDSPYYTYFDINWEHPEYPGQVMVPFLGEDLNVYIEKNQIEIRFRENGFKLCVDQQEFPLSVQGLKILIPILKERNVSDSLIYTLEELIKSSDGSSLEDWTQLKQACIHTLFTTIEYKKLLDVNLSEISSDTSILQTIINAQAYLPVCYKITDGVMNYRRFFTINNLICLKMEDEWVFDSYHILLVDLYKRNIIQGLRLDHVDGLYNPKKYVERLHQALGKDCYIVVEKILESNTEELAQNWGVDGTTGYEFLADTNRVLTQTRGAELVLDFYKSFTSLPDAFKDICFEKKHTFLYKHMGGELSNLMRLYEKSSLKVDGIENTVFKKALGIFMSAFPVYRIYPETFPLPEHEVARIDEAFDRSLQLAPELDIALTFIKNLFVQSNPETDDKKLDFVKRMMQYTSPLAAKGVEDTTFYVYNPLISHNEVGDSPEPLSYSTTQFHERMRMRKNTIPYSLNASSTHDTKRGENGRARINALSYVPKEWAELVAKLHVANVGFIKEINGRPAPSLNDAYFIYQSLMGSMPETGNIDESFIERTIHFLRKSLREAKVETNYDAPNDGYEEACFNFVESILKKDSAFLRLFIPFLQKINPIVLSISLAEVVLKSTAPGIPDLYQGCELEDLSYVDPDNRRAVDYDKHKAFLKEISSLGNKEEAIDAYLNKHKNDEVIKLFVTHKLLSLRKKYPNVFLEGAYLPIETESNVLAFARYADSKWILVVISLSKVNKSNTCEVAFTLPNSFPSDFRNIFVNEIINFKKNHFCYNFSNLSVAVFESVETLR